MPHNRGTRHKPKYVGLVSYRGHAKWVGKIYRAAEQRRLAELRAEVDSAEQRRVPTALEFAGAVIHDNGRITMTWPDGQRTLKKTGRRASRVKRMREALRPFLRDFGERPLDSFGRNEALTWALAHGRNVQQSVRQFFNHATDRELIGRNPFTSFGLSKRTRRIDQPDFEIVSTEQYEHLCQCAREPRR
jgi:hypothetical protein